LIDPPWGNETGGRRIKRGADKHYSLMSVKDIIALPIQRLADTNGAHLYLWTTNNSLQDAFLCLERWEFEHATTITWMKSGRFGLGQYFHGMTEHCLFATTKKKLPYKILQGKRQQGTTGFIAERDAVDDRASKLYAIH